VQARGWKVIAAVVVYLLRPVSRSWSRKNRAGKCPSRAGFCLSQKMSWAESSSKNVRFKFWLDDSNCTAEWQRKGNQYHRINWSYFFCPTLLLYSADGDAQVAELLVNLLTYLDLCVVWVTSFVAYIICRWVGVHTNAMSEAQTPSTSSAGADVSQHELSQPLNKKLRLLENLDSEPEDEPVDSSGNDDVHNVLKEIAAYLAPTVLTQE